MAWVKLDDAILDNHKIIRAGPLGFMLHVAAITWCGRNLTDGLIPKCKARLLLEHERFPDLAQVMVEVGLWHDRGDCWEVHDYLEYNPSRADVLAKREAISEVRAEAGRLGGKQSGITRRSKAEANAEANVKQNRSPVPVPVPKRSRSLRSLLSESNPDFDQFWAAYPRKTGKGAARKAWEQLRPALAAVLEALAWQVKQDRWRAERGKYIPHPATWLTQGRWEDEPDTLMSRSASGSPEYRIRHGL